MGDTMNGIDFTAQLSQEDIFVKKSEPSKEEVVDKKETGQVPVTQEEIFNSSLNKDTTNKEKESEPKAGDKKSPSTPDSDASGQPEKKSPDSLVFAKYLKEQGLLDELNEEEFTKIYTESGEDFAEPLKITIQENLKRKEQQRIEQLDSEARGFRQFVEMKNQGIDPQEAMTLAYQKTQLANIKEEDIVANQDLRKNVLFNLYKSTTQLSDSEINEMIEEKISLKKDVDLTKAAVPRLMSMYEQREKELIAQEQTKKAEEQKQLEQSLADLRTKFPDEFLGNKFHSKTKDKWYEMIAKPVAKLQDGTPVNAFWAEFYKDPNGFQAKWVALQDLGVWDNKIDRIKQVAKTQAVSELENIIKGQSEKMQMSGKGSNDKTELPSQKDARKKAEENFELLRQYKRGSL